MADSRPILVRLTARVVDTHFWETADGHGWGIVLVQVFVDGRPGLRFVTLVNEEDV